MENFEALGRYITAKEQAENFAKARNELLQKARRIIEQSTSGYSGLTIAYEFNAVEVREIIDKVEEADANMHKAADEANRQAELCGKHKIKIEKPYRY